MAEVNPNYAPLDEKICEMYEKDPTNFVGFKIFKENEKENNVEMRFTC